MSVVTFSNVSLWVQWILVERIRWSLQRLPGQHVMSSSFGAQAAVMLRLVRVCAVNCVNASA